jgi:hypothetical protein
MRRRWYWNEKSLHRVLLRRQVETSGLKFRLTVSWNIDERGAREDGLSFVGEEERHGVSIERADSPSAREGVRRGLSIGEEVRLGIGATSFSPRGQDWEGMSLIL